MTAECITVREIYVLENMREEVNQKGEDLTPGIEESLYMEKICI